MKKIYRILGNVERRKNFTKNLMKITVENAKIAKKEIKTKRANTEKEAEIACTGQT